MDVIIENVIILVIFSVITKGNSKVISTSKIRKIIAIKKNWRENGIRAEDLGSKPHSKGDLFSRSINVFFERNLANIITINDNINVINAKFLITIITYTS